MDHDRAWYGRDHWSIWTRCFLLVSYCKNVTLFMVESVAQIYTITLISRGVSRCENDLFHLMQSHDLRAIFISEMAGQGIANVRFQLLQIISIGENGMVKGAGLVSTFG